MKQQIFKKWVGGAAAAAIVILGCARADAGFVPVRALNDAEKACASRASAKVERAVRKSGILKAYKDAELVDLIDLRMMKPEPAVQSGGSVTPGPCAGVVLKLWGGVHKRNRAPITGHLTIQTLDNLDRQISRFVKALMFHLGRQKPLVEEREA
jgi:hypothetical protein